MKMNNISLKKKILLIFIICILIPMITTNGCILWMLDNSLKASREKAIENMADRIEFSLKDQINKQLLIGDYLNLNRMLNDFLDKEYQDSNAYYEAYVKLMEDEIIHQYYTVQSVYSITVCTDNPTLVNGNFFIRKDVVENTEWYRAYKESNKGIILYDYYEDGLETGGYLEKGRKLLIVRKMDRCMSDSVLVLELNYLDLLERMTMECEGVDGYLINQDKIVFSTLDQNNKNNDFLAAVNFKARDVVYSRTIELYDEEYEIRLTADKPQVFDMLKEYLGYLILLFLMNLIVPSIFIYIVYRSFNDRIYLTQQYLRKINDDIYEEIPCEEGKDEIGRMLRSYNIMVRRIKELIEVVFKNKVEQQELEIARKQAELNALQSQLNPHFVFNALESIRMHSILKQEKETAKILESFAVLMRRNIQWNKDFVTIEDECENVRRYLDIQKYRFGDRLDFYIYVQEECYEREIPKFVLITFVENACVHGIEGSVDGGTISVTVSEDEQNLYIEVMDSGSGMEETELIKIKAIVESADMDDIRKAKKSIGIINAVVRLKQYYGEKVRIGVASSIGDGTEVSICIPKKRNF